MSYTRKPCPACGEVDPRRKSDAICSTCQKKLAWADEKLKAIAEPSPSETVTRVGEAAHWNQYIYRGREIRVFLHQLVMAVSRRSHPLGDSFSPLQSGLLGKIDDYGWGIEIIIDAQTAEIITQLRAEIIAALDAAYAEGKADGHKLLMRLATGDIGFNEFDVQTQPTEKRR